MELTPGQLEAVRYYEGDVEGDDPFWGDGKAYVTLNSLFYDGIGTERRRAAEGRRLNPTIVADPARIFDLCVSLISACRAADLSQPRTAYRVERYADYLDMREAGRTISFTSTSTGGFLPAYGDRIGIALLTFLIPAGVPCLPYAELLHDDYAKGNEQEIMLPPGLALTFEETPLRPEEFGIADAQGNPPIVKCVVRVEARPLLSGGTETHSVDSGTASGVLESEGIAAATRVYDALNSGKEPAPEDITSYCTWKQAFKANVLATALMPS